MNAARKDLRIRTALLTGGKFGLPQTLSGAPGLARRYDMVPSFVQAVLVAATDAIRHGMWPPVSKEFLRRAAPGH